MMLLNGGLILRTKAEVTGNKSEKHFFAYIFVKRSSIYCKATPIPKSSSAHSAHIMVD